MPSNLLVQLTLIQIKLSNLVVAFACVIAVICRHQMTILLGRKPPNYLRAKIADGIGALGSLNRLANLPIASTCSRVIYRTFENFDLLNVVYQRHVSNAQTLCRNSTNCSCAQPLLSGANKHLNARPLSITIAELSYPANALDDSRTNDRIPEATHSVSYSALHYSCVPACSLRSPAQKPPAITDQPLGNLVSP